MFLRKLYKVPDKIKWLTLELLVVFVGVYLAFVFQTISADRVIDKEKEKVFVSLKKELDQLRMDLPGFADFQENVREEWDSLANLRQVASFYTWRYIEPQYNFKVIEYAINSEGTDVIDFALYEDILDIYSAIKKLEHTERLMTEYGGRYKNVPDDIDQNGETAKVLHAENRLTFFKFRVFARDRTGILRRVAEKASKIVQQINDQLGPEKTKGVDLALLREYLEADIPMESIEEAFLKHFPQYTVEVLREEAAKVRKE